MPTPTPVGQRLAYDDLNVAQVFFRSDRNFGQFGYDWVQGSQEGLKAMNFDPVTGRAVAVVDRMFVDPMVDDRWIYINFSERMHLQGYSVITFSALGGGGGGNGRGRVDPKASMYWSPNSTNGVDGDWFFLQSNIPPLTSDEYTVYPTTSYANVGALPGPTLTDVPNRLYQAAGSMLDNVQAVDVRNVLGLRLVLSGGTSFVFGTGTFPQSAAVGLYLYGEVQDNGSDALDFWHPYRGEMLPPGYLDWGDVQVSSSGDKAFRLRNRSDTLTAYDVVISSESFFQTVPFPDDQFLFSFDRETWTPTLGVAAMAPGTASARVYVRRVTPAAQAQRYTSVRVRADAGRWV